MMEYIAVVGDERAVPLEADDPAGALAQVAEPVRDLRTGGRSVLAAPNVPLPSQFPCAQYAATCPALHHAGEVCAAMELGFLSGVPGRNPLVGRDQLLEYAVLHARAYALGRILSGDVLPAEPLDLRGIDLEPGHIVPPETRALVEPRLALHYGVCPVAVVDGVLWVVSCDARELGIAWELGGLIDQRCEQLACSRDPRRHELLALDLFERTYQPELFDEREKRARYGLIDWSDGQSRGSREGAALGVVEAFDWRLLENLDAVARERTPPADHESLFERPDPTPDCVDVLERAVQAGCDAVRIEVVRVLANVEYRLDGHFLQGEPLDFAVGAEALIQFAVAAGIPPDTLPRARGEVEIVGKRVVAELDFGEVGERLTLSWS